MGTRSRHEIGSLKVDKRNQKIGKRVTRDRSRFRVWVLARDRVYPKFGKWFGQCSGRSVVFSAATSVSVATSTSSSSNAENPTGVNLQFIASILTNFKKHNDDEC